MPSDKAARRYESELNEAVEMVSNEAFDDYGRILMVLEQSLEFGDLLKAECYSQVDTLCTWMASQILLKPMFPGIVS